MFGYMRALGIALVVIAFVALMIGGWVKGVFNTLVEQDVAVETAWSQVETQYQRRFDLVPQLVGATRGILAQEQAVFGAIAEARTRYANSGDSSREEQIEAYGEYESVLGRLMLIYENYPELKSNEQVQALMDELTGTENRVNIARIRYNESVQMYNITVRRFPTNLIAWMFDYEQQEFFDSVEGSEIAPEVDLIIE